jgi:hypothetical protein
MSSWSGQVSTPPVCVIWSKVLTVSEPAERWAVPVSSMLPPVVERLFAIEMFPPLNVLTPKAWFIQAAEKVPPEITSEPVLPPNPSPKIVAPVTVQSPPVCVNTPLVAKRSLPMLSVPFPLSV